MIFAEKCFPIILRPFRGVLDVKRGCGVRSKSENAKREIWLVPPPLSGDLRLHNKRRSPLTAFMGLLSWSQGLIKHRNPNFYKKSKFLQKSIFLQKIQIFTKNPSFNKKSKFLQKIQIFTKNPYCYKKSKFLRKIKLFQKNFYYFQ